MQADTKKKAYLAHNTLLPWLSSEPLNFRNLIQGNTVFANGRATVADEEPSLTL